MEAGAEKLRFLVAQYGVEMFYPVPLPEAPDQIGQVSQLVLVDVFEFAEAANGSLRARSELSETALGDNVPANDPVRALRVMDLSCFFKALLEDPLRFRRKIKILRGHFGNA